MQLTRTLKRRLPRSARSLFDDTSLTNRASLNALSSLIDYAARLVVGFLLTPFLVSGLGAYYYGMWQIAMRSVGYLSPASGRPSEALKWTLAHEQTSDDYEQKRTYVGKALVAAVLFLPLMLTLGALLAWFVPTWFKTPEPFIWPTRLAVGILVINLVATSLAVIPNSILSGENLAYKRMGMGAVFVFIGGGFTWLALYLDLGITGVAVAALLSTIVTGGFYFVVARRYVAWFGVRIPPLRDARGFLGLSFWFMAWNLAMKLMLSSDVIILGFFDSVEQAGSYTLTKYAPETTIMIIAMIVFGVTPGLGGIIGAGDKPRAARVRGEIMSMSWLLSTALCTTILLWNRTFIGLWVGGEHYLGAGASLLIVLVVVQFVLIRNDANIIDLTLKLPVKVSLGLGSTVLGILIASVLVGPLKLGVVGLCAGLLAGRSVLTVAYPMMIGRFLGITTAAQWTAVLRPGSITAALFALAFFADEAEVTDAIPLSQTWVGFFVLAAATFCLVLALGYAGGFSKRQRAATMTRVRTLLGKATPQSNTRDADMVD